MAAQSIPSHADEASVAELNAVAAREGRSTSHIEASSLRLYLGLPSAIRAALDDVETLASAEEKHNLIRAVARAIASGQYEVARRHAAKNLPANDGVPTTDAAILELAVQMTTRSR